MIFRILLAVTTCALLFYFLILARTALRRLFLVAFFGTGLLFVIRPDLSIRLANVVGIGRGTDLAFYASTVFLFFLSFNFYLRCAALEERQVRIVRELALRRPVQEETDART